MKITKNSKCNSHLWNVYSWGPAVLWMIIIFILSSRQRVSVSSDYIINFLFFKMLHVMEYAILFILNYRAIRLTFGKRWIHSYQFFLACTGTLLFAASDELHQTFVPTREGRARDVIIDGFGGILSWIFLAHILPHVPERLRNWGERLGII